MSVDTSARYGLAPGAATTIRANAVAARALPAPAAEWRFRDIDRLEMPTLRKFRKIGAVEVVENPSYGRASTYRTAKPAWEFISDLDGSPGPCPHRGIRNLRDEDGYSCPVDECDARFDRETAREIVAAIDGGGSA